MTGSSHDSDVPVEASVLFSTVVMVLIVVYRSSSRERGVPPDKHPGSRPKSTKLIREPAGTRAESANDSADLRMRRATRNTSRGNNQPSDANEIDEGDDLVLQVPVVHFFSPQALLLPKGPPIR